MDHDVPLETANDSDGDVEINDNAETINSKTTSVILDIAKLYFGSGRTISMDNYYGGADPLIKLKQN
eukprot:11765045-Ditylum_brightwellii.AAC.1